MGIEPSDYEYKDKNSQSKHYPLSSRVPGQRRFLLRMMKKKTTEKGRRVAEKIAQILEILSE